MAYKKNMKMKIKRNIFCKLTLMAICVIFLAGCGSNKPYHEVIVNNPEFIPNTVFVGYEDLTSPKFSALKEKYRLDTIFHGESDEMKRIFLLRNWINKLIKIDNEGPYPGDGSPESILDEALKGHGFHCGHFTAVQNAVMNAYGYVTRCIIADVGSIVDYFPSGEGHHAVNEIWLNSYHKWCMSDAKYDCHFEKNDIPLSALEVRDEYLKNKAAEITLVKGPDRISVAVVPELKNLNRAQIASIYTWLSWGRFNDRFSNGPKTNTDYMNVYADEYFKNHTWLWNAKPHWAYNTEFMNLITERKAIEWTPNTIASKLLIEGSKVQIELNSNTPNLKTYQMKEMPEGNWKDVSNAVEIELKKEKNEIVFRTINLAGVTGPEHKVIIER
ncbi:MAG: hypothetical protein A2X05_15305 [Bacteroidetes bacterium GWE2_41_25]|nr:MAG: hypothetical protein A2X06_09170 [Bacteroidetes bacterium GWC2_40_22]OFY10874.1 MAG: hypothetical protein A2X05_15305 [Bacteroidetes bacterium GWE2_41_25]OFY56843.1 MAG: hypothetical protein A2X04_02705 [Bacteroidetes bacterium GWF2_41_9]